MAKTRNGVVAALDIGTNKVVCFVARSHRARGLAGSRHAAPRPQQGKSVRPTAVYGAALRLAVALEHL